jgi:hypothetical protein
VNSGHTTGKPFSNEEISNISKGDTYSTIIARFGAPTTISTLGDQELFVYKYCKMKGGSFATFMFANVSSKEYCNELTVIFDKATGTVKDYYYKVGIK